MNKKSSALRAYDMQRLPLALYLPKLQGRHTYSLQFMILHVSIVMNLICFSQKAVAAPAGWEIAINSATQQCAGFWPGDEWIGFSLPSGWKSYSPSVLNDAGGYATCGGDASWGQPLATPYGTCCFAQANEEYCCKQLGLKYIGNSIGVRTSCDLGDGCYDTTPPNHSTPDTGIWKSSGGGCNMTLLGDCKRSSNFCFLFSIICIAVGRIIQGHWRYQTANPLRFLWANSISKNMMD
jgi:hypothetical protein